MVKSCKNCDYGSKTLSGETVICKRYAPKPRYGNSGVYQPSYPIVSNACGEFKTKWNEALVTVDFLEELFKYVDQEKLPQHLYDEYDAIVTIAKCKDDGVECHLE